MRDKIWRLFSQETLGWWLSKVSKTSYFDLLYLFGIWVWINTYTIHTIFRGMNIHKSQLFWCSPEVLLVLTHCHILGLFSQAIRHYLWAASPRMISLSQVIGACDKGLQWLMALQFLRRMTETPGFGVCHSVSFDLQDWGHEVSICWMDLNGRMVAQTWILVCQRPLRARIGVDSADVQLHVSLVCSQRIQLQHDRISFYTASWLEPSASDLPQDDHLSPTDILICFVIFTQQPNWGILRNDKFAMRTNPFFWLVMVCGHLATLPHLGHSCLWKLWQLA